MARTTLRRWAAHPLVRRAVDLVERCDSASARVLRVLTYHRVDEREPFAHHMEHLATRYRVVSIPRVLATLDGGPPLPPRSVLLTFDDAYRSFAEHAWPVLAARSFPAALFVPTAYPDADLPRFWWDRLESAFQLGPRRDPLSTPLGEFPLATPAERARAHAALKSYVKDLPHEETLRRTDEICAALGAPRTAHEVLGWDELRALAAQGVTLGAHTRTHPRLDRVPRERARAEIEGSLADLERHVPGAPRVFAYPDGRFDDEQVALLGALGVELGFTTRRGTNHLARADRLRLRRVNVDARDSLEVFRAKLAFAAARLAPLVRLADPPGAHERAAERRNRSENRRAQLVLRSQDAFLTAELRPRTAALESARRALAPGRSHYDRLGHAAVLLSRVAPALGRRLRRGLLDASRLPLFAGAPALVGFGSGVTVFRLEAPGRPPLALKVYRRTLGRDPRRLVAAARRYRARYRRLCERFGEAVHPAEFVVLHAPLRGVPAVACLQPWIASARDLLALDDDALLALLRGHGGLAERFASFARSTLEWHAEGSFPDLLGRGNLLVVDGAGGPCLRLIDYGIFDPLDHPASDAARTAIRALARRLGDLLERMRTDVAVHA